MIDRNNGSRGEEAIARAFEARRQQGSSALITYLTAGYPSPEMTMDVVNALVTGGGDIIELGVPFSDPVADGPTIQHAAQVALARGMTPGGCVSLVESLRQSGIQVPILLMGYYNPIHSRGVERFVDDCRASGVDGLIVPDLPLEEADRLRDACRGAEIALVFLVAPTTSGNRLVSIAAAATGFLYVVSRLGTTGTQHTPGSDLRARLDIIRRYAHTPIAAGFGIGTPEQAADVAPYVDGVVVGSGVVQRAAHGPDAVREYVAGMSRAVHLRRAGNERYSGDAT